MWSKGLRKLTKVTVLLGIVRSISGFFGELVYVVFGYASV